jgi:hypothetical protein
MLQRVDLSLHIHYEIYSIHLLYYHQYFWEYTRCITIPHACAKIRIVYVYHIMLHLAQQDQVIPHHVGKHKRI